MAPPEGTGRKRTRWPVAPRAGRTEAIRVCTRRRRAFRADWAGLRHRARRESIGAAESVKQAGPGPLPWPCEQPASARWGSAQASRRPAQGADGQPDGTRCLEGHHASGPKRVHLLGRGCQAGDDPRTPHPPDPGGAGGRPASALLLARVQAPRALIMAGRDAGREAGVSPAGAAGKSCSGCCKCAAGSPLRTPGLEASFSRRISSAKATRQRRRPRQDRGSHASD
jgi:hypothetical protein